MKGKNQLSEILTYRQPTSGAMLFALGGVQAILAGQGGQPARVNNPGLRALVDDALQLNTRSRTLEFDWRNQRRLVPLQRKGIGALDAKLDRAISQLYAAIANWADLQVDVPQKALGAALLQAIFPEGVYVITSLRYEDENAAVNELLERLNTEFAPTIVQLALEPFVAQVEALNADYGARLSGVDPTRVTYDQVQQAYQAGLNAYLVVTLRIWNDYLADDATRNLLLAPIQEQDARVSAYYKRRRSAPEVDPQTGEVLDLDELAQPEVDAAAVPAAPVDA